MFEGKQIFEGLNTIRVSCTLFSGLSSLFNGKFSTLFENKTFGI